MSDHPASWLTSRYQLFVAFRYLKARRKQAFTSVVSTVSVLGVVVGVAALIIALALLTGFQGDIQNKIMGANAHIFVQEFGNDTFAGYDEVVRLASNVPGVVAAAPTVLLQGLLQGNLEQPAFVQLKGIDPRGEAKTTELLDRIVEGSPERLLRPYGSPGSLPGIVLGRDLADELAFASVGDIVELIVPSAQSMNPWGGGDVRTPDFEVVGIFDIGMYEYDRTWALISLEAAQSLLEVGERATFVQLKVDDIFATDAIVEQLEEALGDGYYVMDWKRMNRSYFAALQLEKLALFVTISLIVMVAALNIVATLVLMIKDKQRDIGILMSLGAPDATSCGSSSRRAWQSGCWARCWAACSASPCRGSSTPTRSSRCRRRSTTCPMSRSMSAPGILRAFAPSRFWWRSPPPCIPPGGPAGSIRSSRYATSSSPSR